MAMKRELLTGGIPRRYVYPDIPDFGQPELRHDNEGWGQWESKALQAKFKDSYDTNRQFRYGNWAVHLNGGPQASGESWASVSVPLNDLKVADLESIAYDWYAHQLGTSHILDIGPNLVFSAYDPDDHAKRVDFNTYGVDNNIFMSDGLANRPIEAGWYKYEMKVGNETERVYWYGNNTGTHDSVVTEGADYWWKQYVVDNIFQNWVIYRVQVMIGYWGSTRSTGDVWIGNLRINGVPVKWEPSEADKIEIQEKEAAVFGEPFLRHSVAGEGTWSRWHHSKSHTGWTAKLYGGAQSSYNDWAVVSVPVNEMRVPDFKTALWSWNNTEQEVAGVNMVIYVHDPFNPDNRAEITQLGATALLAKAAGWNSHILNPSTDQFYWYGENAGATNLTEGVPNYYGWDDFVADELFNTWTIYRVDFNWGGETGGEEFKDVWVADIQLNGQSIPLKPDSSGTGRIGRKFYTGSSGISTGNGKLAPKTPYRLLSISMHLDAQQTSASSFVVSLLSEQGTNFDPAILTDDMDAPSGKVSLYAPFGKGYEFGMDDELDVVYTNGGSKTYGLTYTYEVLTK